MRIGEFRPTLNVGGVDAESRLREIDGSEIFLSCSRRPLSMNSVLGGLGHEAIAGKTSDVIGEAKRCEVIKEEIWGNHTVEDDLGY